MLILGIDPGKNGGLAVLGDGFPPETLCLAKATEHDVADWLLGRPPITAAYLERVASSPQMGVVSAFTFGKGYGFLRGILTGLRVPYHEVLPRKWQTAMGCLSGGDKNVTKAAAQRLWPTMKVTHAIADALLLAECGRRIEMALRTETGGAT